MAWAGRLLRNLILKRDEAINRLPIVNHRLPLWEREPLRWQGVNFGLAAAGSCDGEERLTGRPSRVAPTVAIHNWACRCWPRRPRAAPASGNARRAIGRW